MEIDLFTWGAQIVNFLILVALLRHFLYGRIVHAIDTRQEKIASRWDEAER
ncbi:MAG: F0F1 ATP synthase subunit B, partial [Desulfomonilia bacterium]|nr:F0F1 ATP synthase subunit B [Desulfomonilia bacterium]